MARNVRVDEGRFRFAQSITAGPHLLQADEPSEVGGHDTGPGPFELLLAALGACASITVRMYAERKQWPLDGVHVELSYAQPHDSASNGGGRNALEIEMEIFFAGDLSNDQRARLLQIANQCPVHRALTSSIQIRSRLAGGRLLKNTEVEVST
jgi:putative redox protein